MRGRYVLIAMFALAVTASAWAGDEFILTAPESEAYKLAERQGLTILHRIPKRDVFLVQGPAGVRPNVVMARLLADPEIDDEHDKIFIELNAVVHLPEVGAAAPYYTSTSDAQTALLDRTERDYFGSRVWSRYARQRAASRIRLREAHRDYGTGTGIVAVIDSGVDPQHPALAHALLEGYDFTIDAAGATELTALDANHPILNPTQVIILDNDTVVPINAATQALLEAGQAYDIRPGSVPEAFGHGTMVASLVRLVAPGAAILPLKAFDAAGYGRVYGVVRALYHARVSGAAVVNLSLSMPGPSKALADAIQFLHEEKVFTVAAVGNDGTDLARYPAALPETFGVAAVNAWDQRSAFSNFGPESVSLAAPGEALIAAYPGGQYALAWGTSFATPLVSGTIAVLQLQKSGINWEEVERAFATADLVSDPGMGAGRLNTYRAVSEALGIPLP